MAPKKGAKKAAAATKEFAVGDLVTVKIKSYPSWPGRVVDPETEPLSEEVKKLASKSRPLLIKFFQTADYHWASAKEPAALSEKAIDSWLSNHTKGGALRSSYELAKDPEEWEQETIKKQRIALERAANEDELDDEDDDDEAAETGKKRKRAPVKPKAGASKSSKKVKTEAGPSKKKAKGDDEKKKAAKPGDDEAEGLKQCREWRNKLQKAFLGGAAKLPKAEEMPSYDKIFSEIEAFEPEGVWLEASKLPKVLKRVALIDDSIPRDDEFHLKKRAASLVDKFKNVVYPDGTPADDDAEPEPTAAAAASDADDKPAEADEAAPATNGTTEPAAEADDAMKVDEEAPKADAADEAPAAEEAAAAEEPAAEEPAAEATA